MKDIGFITPELKRLDASSADVLVLFRFEELRPLCGAASLVDWRLYGHLSRLIIGGFITGQRGESFLMPLGRHLGPSKLLILGLGPKKDFDEHAFRSAIRKMFESLRLLGAADVLCALPGRPEEVCETSLAIEWFLSDLSDDAIAAVRELHILEPTGPQKAMVPLVERWRLRQLIPPS